MGFKQSRYEKLFVFKWNKITKYTKKRKISRGKLKIKQRETNVLLLRYDRRLGSKVIKYKTNLKLKSIAKKKVICVDFCRFLHFKSDVYWKSCKSVDPNPRIELECQGRCYRGWEVIWLVLMRFSYTRFVRPLRCFSNRITKQWWGNELHVMMMRETRDDSLNNCSLLYFHVWIDWKMAAINKNLYTHKHTHTQTIWSSKHVPNNFLILLLLLLTFFFFKRYNDMHLYLEHFWGARNIG